MPSLFRAHVLEGLSQSPPRLSSRYLYDEVGSRLFQDIMQLDSYYLTRAEFEILERHAGDLYALIAGDGGGAQPFELVELGAGDGTKTKLLLADFLARGADFTYRPIDISTDALEALCADLRQGLPDLAVDPLAMSYEDALASLGAEGPQVRRVVLFLGSNIGNFTLAEAGEFCAAVVADLHAGDLFVIGIDLRKDPRTVLAAYDDPQGVTAAFNLNLLRRINRELGGDFDLDAWRFYPTYDPDSGEVRSYLYPVREQTVTVGAVTRTFGPGEFIHTEVSRKYSLDELAALAAACGCTVEAELVDGRGYFADVVWRKG